MKPVYTVKKNDVTIAVFETQKAAYRLREEKREELPNDCHVAVEKHVLFEDYDDRERLRS